LANVYIYGAKNAGVEIYSSPQRLAQEWEATPYIKRKEKVMET
jgi:predicted nucleic acid-binding protein